MSQRLMKCSDFCPPLSTTCHRHVLYNAEIYVHCLAPRVTDRYNAAISAHLLAPRVTDIYCIMLLCMPTSLKWEALPVPGCLVVAAAAAGGRPLVPDGHGHRLQPLIRHTQVEGRQVGTQLMRHTLHNLRVDRRHLLASTT